MQSLKELLSRAIAAVGDLIHHPTKTKLHRALHVLLTVTAVGASVVVWIQGQHWGWSTWNQIEAQSVIVGTYVARAEALFRRADALVDKLPIPVDDPPTKPETPTTKGSAA